MFDRMRCKHAPRTTLKRLWWATRVHKARIADLLLETESVSSLTPTRTFFNLSRNVTSSIDARQWLLKKKETRCVRLVS